MSIFPLDEFYEEDGDCANAEVFIPGPAGPPIVSVGSFLSPVTITDTIAAPVNRRQRTFIQALAAPAVQPTIPNPGDNGPWELYLWVVGGYPVTLNDATNIKLSGQWVGIADSILYLQWDGNARYVEGGRNEI